jgi:hypothetical protein
MIETLALSLSDAIDQRRGSPLVLSVAKFIPLSQPGLVSFS